MKQKTNGKIVIAIVAMFAVAVSVIGFTYAYFTANLTVNTQNESVEVTAGKLIASFYGTHSINAEKVVPGWISDNLHYYNSEAITDGKIRTTLLNETDDATAYAALVANPYVTGTAVDSYRALGLTAPVAFTVSNISENSDPDDKVYYYVRLNVETNGIRALSTEANCTLAANLGSTPTQEEGESDDDYNARVTAYNTKLAACKDDYKNATVSLYRGSFVTGGTYADEYDGVNETTGVDETNVALVSKLYLAATGTTQILVTEPEELLRDAADLNYFVVFEYANDTANEQFTKNATIKATVEIIGVQKNASDQWVDADNNVITFPTISDGKYLDGSSNQIGVVAS